MMMLGAVGSTYFWVQGRVWFKTMKIPQIVCTRKIPQIIFMMKMYQVQTNLSVSVITQSKDRSSL